MRIGNFIGTMGAASTLAGQVAQSAEAEADGFESFWTAQVAGVDALTLLALCGGGTNSIELGTAVVPIYPRHPMALAQQALTTQAASGGRLLLGIGLSHRPVVEGRWGMDFRAPARYMDEYLTVLQSLLTSGEVDFQGERFSVSGEIARMTDTPPTVCIAALAPRMLRIAGSRADGTITWMVGPRTLDTHITPSITAAAEGARTPGAPRVRGTARLRNRRHAGGHGGGGGQLRTLPRPAQLPPYAGYGGRRERGGGRYNRRRSRGGSAVARVGVGGRDGLSGFDIPRKLNRRGRGRFDGEDARTAEVANRQDIEGISPPS